MSETPDTTHQPDNRPSNEPQGSLPLAAGSGSLADRLAALRKCRTFKRAAAMRRNESDKYLWIAATAFRFDQ